MAFDALNCLRSALDHAVFAATVTLTGMQNPGRTKFPFADTPEGLAAEFKRGARDVPNDLHSYLLGLKPYGTGNRLLWGFNKVRNENIHRILSPIAHVAGSLAIGGSGFVESMSTVEIWDSEKRELTYLKSKGMDPGIRSKITIDIAFVETSDLPNQSVIGVLERLIVVVGGVIDGIEMETASILARRS